MVATQVFFAFSAIALPVSASTSSSLRGSSPVPTTPQACSWIPLGSVALQSYFDAAAADIDGYNPYDTRYESETGCQEVCQSLTECAGYSWRSGGRVTHKHYHKCFLVSRVGGGNVAKDDWFTSALCPQHAPTTTTTTAAPTTTAPQACSWIPLGSVALQSYFDATAADMDGYNPYDARYESETGCQELCQSITECVGYSWRSGEPTHKHYHKCFLVSRVGGGNVARDEWFTSALCPQHWQHAPTSGMGGCTASTYYDNNNEVETCGCNSSVLSRGTQFCLHGQTLAVGSSWDTIHCGGATIKLDSPVNFTWNSGDNITIGICKQS